MRFLMMIDLFSRSNFNFLDPKSTFSVVELLLIDQEYRKHGFKIYLTDSSLLALQKFMTLLHLILAL